MLTLLKSLADPCRLRLVDLLLRGEFTVQELTRMLGMGQSRISRHLKILAEAGVLDVKRQGTWSYYRVGGGNPLFSAMLPALEQGLARLPGREEDLAALARILEERRSRSQQFFDRHALQWDDLCRTLLPVSDYLERLVAAVPDGATLLEVGVGTGTLLLELAAGGRRVIGVDHSPAMLEEARHRVEAAGLERVELRLGEMTHLPLPNESVDCVVANMVLHHAPDPPAVLREIRRVLAPGGLLLLADLIRHEREWVREQLADQWLGFEEDELRVWLQSAGFEATTMERIAPVAGREGVLLVRGTGRYPTTTTDSATRQGE
jgi:ubiquinone/menaquinone biosynthesis C-methylase UbiE